MRFKYVVLRGNAACTTTKGHSHTRRSQQHTRQCRLMRQGYMDIVGWRPNLTQRNHSTPAKAFRVQIPQRAALEWIQLLQRYVSCRHYRLQQILRNAFIRL